MISYKGSYTTNFLFAEFPNWTMTPGSYSPSNSYAFPFVIHYYGGVSTDNGHNSYYVRPVINLSLGVNVTGTGTATNPYKVQ